MVKGIVTAQCNSHRSNMDYPTLLIMFDGSETNVRPLGWRGNWQIRDSELMQINKVMATLSPTFAEDLVRYALTLDTWSGKTHVKIKRDKIKSIEKLEELLL